MGQVIHECMIQNEEIIIRGTQMLHKLDLVVSIVYKLLIKERSQRSIL